MAQSQGTTHDVVVIGGGNAGLFAAIAARRQGARVLLVEKSERARRGGNSKFTRNLRCLHDSHQPPMVGAYTEAEFIDDLKGVSDSGANRELASMVIRRSATIPRVMEQNGARWQPALRSTLGLARTNRFFLGGGKALINAYYHVAESLGVEVLYETTATALDLLGSRCRAVTLRQAGRQREIRPRAVVVAAGGFEANLDWLGRHWGSGVENWAVRGSRDNDGLLLRLLLDHGGQPVGDPKSFHAVAVDARGPRFEGGIVTRIDAIPFGIVVDEHGRRFSDEGEDLWPKRYATWGALIAGRPNQRAFVILDSKAHGQFMPTPYPPIKAGSLEELATSLGVSANLAATVRRFNAAVVPEAYNPQTLDGAATRGLDPPKSNWARRIDTPPFLAYPLRPGITFTYLGVKVDRRGRLVFCDGRIAENLYCAGEIMAGNILTRGYLAGVGMTIGTVFGYLTGCEAGRDARA